MAIVLVIIGLLVGLVAPIVTDMIKREKSSAASSYAEQVKNEIIGFAIINKRLPTADELGTRVDPYGNTLIYIAPSALTASSICDSVPDEDDLYTIEEIMPDGSSPASNSYKNIAFVIASPGRNLTQQFTDPNSDNEITLYDPRVPNDDASAAVKRSDDLEAYDDTVLYVSYNYLRSKVCTSANNSYNPPGSDVSFSQNMVDFAGASQGGASTSADPHAAGGGSVSVNITEGTIEMEATTSPSAACVWYQGSSAAGNCSDANAGDGRGNGVCDWGDGVRAYFTFQLDADAADQNRGHGGGFTFALVDGNNGPQSCGAATGSDSWMGYSEVAGDLGADGGVSAPKMAVEVDTFADGSKCDPGYNHSALVYWTGNAQSNKHGEDIPAASASGVSVTPTASGAFTAFNPTLDSASIAADSADADANTYAACQDDLSPLGPKNIPGFTNATGAGDNKRNWLEDGLEKHVRIEVYANPAAPGWYNATVWMDCSNCADLTEQWEGNASRDGNGNKIHHVLHANPNTWPTIRFGWTMSSDAVATGQTIIVSDFGLKFL
jgi:type II secretory pathway pseudopilin PulG